MTPSDGYLNLLGLDETASLEDVAKAYRRLAKDTHPDTSGKDGSEFRAATEAYEYLQKNHVQREAPSRTFDDGNTQVFRFQLDVFAYRDKFELPLASSVMERDTVIELTTVSHGISGFRPKYYIRIRKNESLPKRFYMADMDTFIVVDIRRLLW